jgi:hypothetical protein
MGPFVPRRVDPTQEDALSDLLSQHETGSGHWAEVIEGRVVCQSCDYATNARLPRSTAEEIMEQWLHHGEDVRRQLAEQERLMREAREERMRVARESLRRMENSTIRASNYFQNITYTTTASTMSPRTWRWVVDNDQEPERWEEEDVY